MKVYAELNVFITYLLVQLAEGVAEVTSEQCLSLGFNKANLLCSHCKELSDFQLNELKENCTRCCTSDSGTPEVQAFVKGDRPARYPGLTIKYVRGADPVIKLMNEEEVVEETLAIDKWNTDSVEEFLNLYLEVTDEAGSSQTDASAARDDL